ncbi:homoserine kinase [Ghiorsea bivora]|uniref:homoserine kinase n=1 Tax=Ghiorsea bivora TaxID=1485545 RepID=UPI0005714ACA|nr:homoserine kinase [Ghiorsea bivora]
MSVYTELTTQNFESILVDYSLGKLQSYTGIAAGIENSNFFIDMQDGKRYVLTVFERLDAQELPYFMRLMKHLASHGLQSPDVMVRKDGTLIFALDTEEGIKQGCIVSCLAGETLDFLNEAQLASSAGALATLHVAGSNFAEHRENPTNFTWLEDTIADMQADVAKTYGQDALDLLNDELAYQKQQHVGDLPSGVIHGDLFVDNILFEGNQVSGVIDFYYAHNSAYVMDIAIAINAQAIVFGDEDKARMAAFLKGYESKRALTAAEKSALHDLLRLAALRFWVSRLFDALYPRDGAMTQTKDPEEYREKLLLHRA